MININELSSAPVVSPTADDGASRHALYCPQTGRRLAPERGMAPPEGTAIAVVVFEDGETISVHKDVLLGRSPELDPAVVAGDRDAVTIVDPTKATSRSHLLLRQHNWDLHAVDLGSRNGTLVLSENGEWLRLTPGLAHPIADGQRLRIGSRTVAVHYTARLLS